MHDLQKIGMQLDRNLYPKVYNGGIVKPNDDATAAQTMGEENHYARERQSGSSTGSRKRAKSRERQARRQRAPDPAPPLTLPDLQMKYEGELEVVNETYPETRIWRQPEGYWLLTKSSLLPGLQQKAIFLTGIPFSRTRVVQSWGFWDRVPLNHPTWIGPRHTNFPHGSICAFHPKDKVWRIGDPIVHLLALYTLWALRHLHLQTMGRWPGKQAAHIPYERIAEFNADEFCGCEQSESLYRDCCLEKDLSGNLITAYKFYLFRTGSPRKPPDSVINFVRSQNKMPLLNDLLPKTEEYPKKFIFRLDPCNNLDLLEKLHYLQQEHIRL